MKKTGPLLMVLAVLNTLSLWVLSKTDSPADFQRPLLALGQAAGLVGATLISLNFILAARFRFMDKLFGGLDKTYKAHAFAGALGFIFVLNHPLLLALNVLPSTRAAKMFLLPSGNLGYTLGIAALSAIIFLLLVTLFVKLPYHLWKYTHALMVIPLGLAIFHMLKVSSDVSEYRPLKFWVIGLGALGIAVYVYRKFLYPRLGPLYHYRIAQTVQRGDIIELTLEPAGKKLAFLPGQFVFVSFCNDAVGKEEHPFSISSGPQDKNLRLSVKLLGNYTKRLPLLKPGEQAKVYGPYGSFAERSLTTSKDNIWIAGGIGITPFLSMLGHYGQNHPAKNIWLFYSSRTRDDAPYLDEISANAPDKFRLVHRPSSQAGRLDAAQIAQVAGGLKNKLILMCGPKPMTDSLYEQFLDLGVSPRNIVFEEFSFR